jgi:prevent-host-death family protein
LSALIDRVQHGKSILIVDRGRPVARLEPVRGTTSDEDEARLARLERLGIVRRSSTSPPMKVIASPPPRSRASVLAALLDERANGR